VLTGASVRQTALSASLASLLLAASHCARADGPAFDRPGIAFAPSTLPADAWAWEQGLPDFQRDRSGGETSSAYVASTRVRYGVTDRFEIQAAIPIFEELDTHGSGRAFRESGTGDFGVAAKYSVIQDSGPVSLAVLAAISFPTATRGDLGNDSEQYSVGATVGRSLGETQSVALYANVDVLDGDARWTLSPNWSFALSPTLAGYVEAGLQPAGHGQPSNDTAGGGFAWMVRPTVQLDAYVLAGLTRASTDFATGCGASVYFP
jgi:hypothetical protein